MKRLGSLDQMKSLLERPLFTAKDANAMGIYSSLICHYVKTGRLRRLSRGTYQSRNYQSSDASSQWEDLISAVLSISGGVVCLISALAVYDIAEQIPRQHWIAVKHSTSIKRERIIKIVRLRNMNLGKTFINLEGVKIPIFNRERTIVDAFRLLSHESAIKALKMALSQKGKQRLDLKKLQAYAKKLRVNIDPYLMAVST